MPSPRRAFTLLTMLVCLLYVVSSQTVTVRPVIAGTAFMTEAFVNSQDGCVHFMQGATDPNRNSFLSESIGLWLEYAAISRDLTLLEQSFNCLVKVYHGLSQNSLKSVAPTLLPWNITKSTTTHTNDDVWKNYPNPATATALLDDFRVAWALYYAGTTSTLTTKYKEWAQTIYQELADFHQYSPTRGQSVFTLAFDLVHKYINHNQSVFYVFTLALDHLYKEGMITAAQLQANKDILFNVDTNNSYFACTFSVDLPSDDSTSQYTFANPAGLAAEQPGHVNMIEQAYIALFMAQWDPTHTKFVNFMAEMERIFDLYSSIPCIINYETKSKPSINGWDFECGSVYALLIQATIQAQDASDIIPTASIRINTPNATAKAALKAFGMKLYNVLVSKRQNDNTKPCYGGWVYDADLSNANAHSFENFIPLTTIRMGSMIGWWDPVDTTSNPTPGGSGDGDGDGDDDGDGTGGPDNGSGSSKGENSALAISFIVATVCTLICGISG